MCDFCPINTRISTPQFSTFLLYAEHETDNFGFWEDCFKELVFLGIRDDVEWNFKWRAGPKSGNSNLNPPSKTFDFAYLELSCSTFKKCFGHILVNSLTLTLWFNFEVSKSTTSPLPPCQFDNTCSVAPFTTSPSYLLVVVYQNLLVVCLVFRHWNQQYSYVYTHQAPDDAYEYSLQPAVLSHLVQQKGFVVESINDLSLHFESCSTLDLYGLTCGLVMQREPGMLTELQICCDHVILKSKYLPTQGFQNKFHTEPLKHAEAKPSFRWSPRKTTNAFSLLTSGLESFDHKSTPSDRHWTEA